MTEFRSVALPANPEWMARMHFAIVTVPRPRDVRRALLVAALLIPLLGPGARAQSDEEDLAAAEARAEALFEKMSAKLDKRTVKLLEDLTHRNSERRAEAAGFLGDLEVTEAVPGLTVLLSDSDDAVRDAAAGALWKIGRPGAEPARSALEKALATDQNGRVRVQAAGALWALGVAKDKLRPQLKPVLEDRSGYTRVRAANLLGRMGAPIGELLDVYRAAMSDPNSELRLYTMRSLMDGDDKPSELTPLMLSAMKDSYDVVRALAITWLHVVGKPSAEVVAAWREAAGDRSSSVRSAALDALGSAGAGAAAQPSGGGGGAAEAELLAGLRDRKTDVRVSAAEGLGGIRASSPQAVSALIEALGDKKDDVRAAAAEALGEIGAPARSAVSRLQALWDDRGVHWTVRHAAGGALDKLGTPVDWSSEG